MISMVNTDGGGDSHSKNDMTVGEGKSVHGTH